MTETTKPWPEQVTALIAAQVERYRMRQGLRGDDLAQRCTALGYRLDKSALSKMATGTRKSLTVAEMLVLAAALGVPPLALLLPMQESETVEMLPETGMPLDVALAWLDGSGPVPGPPGAEAAPDGYPPSRKQLHDLRQHARLMWEARAARVELNSFRVAQRIDMAGASGYDSAIADAEREVKAVDEALREHRARMRRHGWTALPRLGGGLEGIEDVSTDA